MTDWQVAAGVLLFSAAPVVIVVVFAILRGYTIHLTMRRDRARRDD